MRGQNTSSRDTEASQISLTACRADTAGLLAMSFPCSRGPGQTGQTTDQTKTPDAGRREKVGGRTKGYCTTGP